MNILIRRRVLLCLFAIVEGFGAFPLVGSSAETPPSPLTKEKDRGSAGADLSLRLTLPPQCFAVVGQEFRIDFGNLLPADAPHDLRFAFDLDIAAGDIAKQEKADRQSLKRLSLIPGGTSVGRYRLKVSARSADGKLLDEAATELCIAPADAGAGRDLTLLIVGDSLTHATLYPNELARLLSLPGNPKWTMLGTHRPPSAAAGVAHEGYGGWQWRTFVSQYAPKPDLAKRIRSSPFVFVGSDGKPRLDVPR